MTRCLRAIRLATIPCVAALAATATSCRSNDDMGSSPSRVVVVGGSNQQAAVGTAVATAPAVRVQDGTGAGVAGVTVHFAVVAGNGTVFGDSVRSDPNGMAQVGEWILGTSPGSNTLRANIPGTSISATIGATAVPGAPVAVRASGQTGFLALVGNAVSPAPAVLVIDSYNNPVPATTATFSVVSGNGSVTNGTVTTNNAGIAQVGSWVLGTVPGANSLQASIPAGGASLVLTAQGLNAAPVLSATSPTSQNGFLQYPVTKIPRVLVQDALGHRLPGVPVTFAVTAGDGTISGGLAITNSSGIASPSDWRLGLTAGTITATTDLGATPVAFSAAGTAPSFVVDVRFLTSVDADERDTFIAAAHRWMSIFTAHLTPVALNLPAGACSNLQPAVNETVRDLVIFAEVTPIDGDGDILGSGSPCAARSGSGLTIVGTMQFDAADFPGMVANGQATDVITHEMAHVLGFGTEWTGRNLATGIGGADPRFTGGETVSIWPPFADGLGFVGATPPLENLGGSGTAGSHWRESVFNSELMTGYIEEPGVPMPISRLTIATFKDMGYQVDYSQADPFVGLLLAKGAVRGPARKLNERIGTVRWQVTPSGEMHPMQ
jgi:leishmanolysin